jgi:hypothetical protein
MLSLLVLSCIKSRLYLEIEVCVCLEKYRAIAMSGGGGSEVVCDMECWCEFDVVDDRSC